MKTTIRRHIELEFEIEADVSPYDPGRRHGPPELCYPPEGGEVEISKIRLAPMDKEKLPEGLAEEFGDALYRLLDTRPELLEEIEAECAEQAAHRDEREWDDAA